MATYRDAGPKQNLQSMITACDREFQRAKDGAKPLPHWIDWPDSAT
jgi:hypothetical protein